MKNNKLLEKLNGSMPCICCSILVQKLTSVDQLDVYFNCRKLVEEIIINKLINSTQKEIVINKLSFMLRDIENKKMTLDELNSYLNEILIAVKEEKRLVDIIEEIRECYVL